MSFSFPPIYQPYINLYSPFPKVEPVEKLSRPYNDKIETLVLYDKKGQIQEYCNEQCNKSRRV